MFGFAIKKIKTLFSIVYKFPYPEFRLITLSSVISINLNKKNMKTFLSFLAIACILISCGSTSTVTNFWAKDNYSFREDPGKKILVVGISPDANNGKIIEREIKNQMKKGLPYSEIVGAHEVILGDLTKENIDQYVKTSGFTHILSARLADVKKDIEYTPGKYYASVDYYSSLPVYYSNYGVYFTHALNANYREATIQEHIEYSIETNLYSVKKNGLVYSQLSSSFQGSKFHDVIVSTLENMAKGMKKAGLY